MPIEEKKNKYFAAVNKGMQDVTNKIKEASPSNETYNDAKEHLSKLVDTMGNIQIPNVNLENLVNEGSKKIDEVTNISEQASKVGRFFSKGVSDFFRTETPKEINDKFLNAMNNGDLSSGMNIINNYVNQTGNEKTVKEILTNYFNSNKEDYKHQNKSPVLTSDKLAFLDSYGVDTNEYRKNAFNFYMDNKIVGLAIYITKDIRNENFRKGILQNYFDSHKEDYKNLNNDNALTGDKLLLLSNNGVDIDQYCREVYNLSIKENDLKSANDMIQFLNEHKKENLAQEIVNEHKPKISTKEHFYNLMTVDNFKEAKELITKLDEEEKNSLITNYMKDAISYNTLPLEMNRAKFLIQDLEYDPYKKYGDNKESVFELAEKQESLQTLTLINKIKSADKEITNRVKPYNTLNEEFISTLSEDNREKLEKDIKELKKYMEEKQARKQPKGSELISDYDTHSHIDVNSTKPLKKDKQNER